MDMLNSLSQTAILAQGQAQAQAALHRKSPHPPTHPCCACTADKASCTAAVVSPLTGGNSPPHFELEEQDCRPSKDGSWSAAASKPGKDSSRACTGVPLRPGQKNWFANRRLTRSWPDWALSQWTEPMQQPQLKRARTGQESPLSVSSPAAVPEGPRAWPDSPESVQSPATEPASPATVADHLHRTVGTITTVRPGQHEHAVLDNSRVRTGATVLIRHAVQASQRAMDNWRDLLHLLCRTFRVDEICVWFEDWLISKIPVELIADSPVQEIHESP